MNGQIEIGAAMALYGRRYILLARDGVRLPSNLPGLYEVQYSGEALDGDTTMRARWKWVFVVIECGDEPLDPD